MTTQRDRSLTGENGGDERIPHIHIREVPVDEIPAWAVRLRAERRNRCWSQKEMAKRLADAADGHVRAHMPTRESLTRMLRDWEAGRYRPRDPYPQLYARAFDIAEAKLFDEAPDISSLPRWELDLPPISGVAARYVTPELVGYFKDQLLIHYRADALLGPRHLVGPVSAQFASIIELASSAEPELRRELFRLAAAYAAFVGWLYQDAGSTERAFSWLSTNLEMAHRAHDVHMVSHALTNRAMLSADLGDATAVIDLTEAALVDFLVGNACRTPNYLLIQRATCYTRLGLTQQSSALWEEIIPAMPATSRRDIGVFRARQAVALAVTEPEQAADVAAEALQIAQETGSARLIRELAGLRSRMTLWADSSVGRDLAEKLADLT
ncbi:transcriptional regulator with XRE-family HTH domain [Streptosporangium album]|uniref:Transcriptional regulator with XRE-family HTH domain n=1 Tax=Streptosporangium album TaxID=47479 RepID=A0A7W7RXJ8_9ACTN|nr:hypothetical protein [Streptosporangium album]MBB4940069.1 transcriptional regulator with XRE-family HTH domain [Streptosporangium album]